MPSDRNERNCFYCHNFEVCKEKGNVLDATRPSSNHPIYIPNIHNDCLTWFIDPPMKKEVE